MVYDLPSGVARLLTAIRQGGDFPAMAHTVDAISRLTSAESTSSQELANTILHDYGLTQKLLRMVNSLAYSQYGEVTTVTRAVMLMGFERIRSMTTSLIMFEHFRKQAKSPALTEVLNKAFCSAVLGRSIAQASGVVDAEEAFISTLYHRLGNVLLAFYLPADYSAIQAAPEGERARKAVELLGVTVDALGGLVADELRLPERLRQTMIPVPPDDLGRPLAASERLSCLASMSNAITDLMTAPGDFEARRGEIERVAGMYGEHLPLKDGVTKVISSAVSEVKSSSATFHLRVRGSKLMARLSPWGPADAQGRTGSPAAAALGADVLADEDFDEEAPPPDPPEKILTQGLREVTSLLVGDYSLDDVLRIVLETMYRALGVDRTKVIFLLKDPSAPVARFRFGFGHSAAEATLWAELRISGTDDFISQAITLDKDIFVRNARIPSVAQALPKWLVRQGVLDRHMLLLPLTVGSRPLGLFFIDVDKQSGPATTPAVIDYFKLLRGQVVVAIERRAKRGPGQ